MASSPSPPPGPWEDAARGPRTRPPPRLHLALAAVLCLAALELAASLTEGGRRLTGGDQLGHDVPSSPEASAGPRPRRAAASPPGAPACEEEHHSKAFGPIVFFLITYLLSAFAQQIEILSPSSFRVPHSVNLFLSGLMLGWIGHRIPDTELGRAISDFTTIDPHIIFWVLLPALLYEDASGVKWHVMKKVLPSALLLAVPGVILNALLTGAIIKGTFGTSHWTWDSAFLLGSILSATDPVAVVGALHELAAPDRLSLLISGESLFNDGSAVVIFSLFWDSARGVRELTPGYSVAYFIRLACGGPMLGFAFALVVFQWLKHTRKFSIEILVIVAAVYGSFFVAEHSEVKVSGVLAVVIFGFFMSARGHFALAIEENCRHHAVIRFLALLSNEAIFVLGGVVAFRVLLAGVYRFVLQDWFELLWLYVVIHGTRALIIVLCYPVLSRWGYGLSPKEALICLFGGLRGAVGLAMALMVQHDDRLDDDTRAKISFHTSGIVLATLLINGTLVTTLYQRLKVYEEAQHHVNLLRMALLKADSVVMKREKVFEQHWFFHNCWFTDLLEAVPNLVQAAEDLDNGHSSTGHMRVNDVMTKIAHRLGCLEEEEMHDRYMQKLRYRRRWARSASNVFLPVSLANAHEDEETHNIVIELALRMAASLEHQKPKRAEAAQNEDQESSPPASARSEDEAESKVIPRPESMESRPKPESMESRPKPQPILAWSDDVDNKNAQRAETPTTSHRRPQSCGVHFGSEDEEVEVQVHVRTTRSEDNKRVNVRSMTKAARARSGLRRSTALPSEMGEKDQRNLYNELKRSSWSKQQEQRKMNKQAAATQPESPKPGDSPHSPAPAAKDANGRTNLQAQRVAALFADSSIQTMGSAITQAVVSKELSVAMAKQNRSAIAIARWKIAKARVFWALRTLQDALEEHQALVEGAEKGARVRMMRTKSWLVREFNDDFASLVEMYHVILNSTRSAYKEMYETLALPEGPFRVLMESLELQEEAIDGELQSAPHVPNDPLLNARLQSLPTASHEDQTDASFIVAYQYIAQGKNRSRGNWCDSWQKRYFHFPQWWQMQQDVVMMLAFIMTQESIGDELEIIQSFEGQVKKPMLQVTEQARATVLYQLMLQNPAMFYLFEHVLCLRLMLDFQRRLCKDLVRDGLLPEEDADHIIKRVIKPTLIALDRYVPTREHLRIATRRYMHVSMTNPRVHPDPADLEKEVTTAIW